MNRTPEPAVPDAPPAEVSFDELQRILADGRAIVVDALSPEAHRAGHVPGSINLPLADLAERAPRDLPDRERPIVVYCASATCPIAGQAARGLRARGYRDVRVFPPGIAGWEAAGGPLEVGGRPVVAAPASVPAPTPAPAPRLADRLLDHVEGIVGQTASRLLLLWLAIILVFGIVYWLPARFGVATLLHGGAPVPGTLGGLGTALYFSFITGLSVGYGDVVPIGWWRVPAIMEGAADLLLFGFVISKIMSRRQDQVLDQIRATAFEERMGRVRTNLHLTLSEFEAIATACREGVTPAAKVRARAESATFVFAGELRTIHQLLYRPQQAPDEAVLEGLLATLAANLDGLRDLLDCQADGAPPSPAMRAQLRATTRLADEICGDCVPHAVGPALRMWMDRIQERARALPA